MVSSILRNRGYSVDDIEVNGHEPDFWLPNEPAFLDVKTNTPGKANISIEIPSLDFYSKLVGQGHRVFILHARDGLLTPSDWTVDTLQSVSARALGGPHRRSGSGSNDDWQLFAPGGTPFNEFFA
jgi:hypothetical protein